MDDGTNNSARVPHDFGNTAAFNKRRHASIALLSSERQVCFNCVFVLVFFGNAGAHRFYCGKTESAVAQLLITIISIPLFLVLIGFVSLFANLIWVLIDVIMISGWIRESNQRLVHLVAQ